MGNVLYTFCGTHTETVHNYFLVVLMLFSSDRNFLILIQGVFNQI